MKYGLSMVAVGAAVIFSGCGDDALSKKVDLKFDAIDQSAALEFELGDGTELSLSGEYAVADGQATIYFTKPTRTETGKVGIRVAASQWLDGLPISVGQASTLPNGESFPVAITPPLLQVPVMKSKDFDLNALVSIRPELQAGATLGIKQMANKYIPEGITLCQNFRNKDRVAVAAICLYGPKGQTSGGLFFGGNFGEVFSADEAEAVASDVSADRVYLLSAAGFPIDSYQMSIYESDTKEDWKGKKSDKALRNLAKIFR